MPKLSHKRAVLAKIETTYGTDPTPTGAANAILLRNLNISPIAATIVGRDLIRPYLGESDQLIANAHVECDFEVEVAGSGTAGTAPAYGVLLRACGMSEVISAGVSVTYAPISTTFESCTIYYNVDGILHKITGARGTVSVDISAKQIPIYKFKFWGIYNAVTDTAAPTPTYTGFITPLVANLQNTTPFSFYSVTTLVLQNLTFDVGNTVDFRALIGSEYVQVTDRNSSGEVTFEQPAISVLDIFGSARNNTTGGLSITHGTVGGNKVTFAATKVDISQPSYVDDNGVVMCKAPFAMIPTSGNDEFSIVVL